MPKIITFLAKPIPKLHNPPASNAMSKPLYTYLLLLLFFTILVAPHKQFFNLKLLRGIFGQSSQS